MATKQNKRFGLYNRFQYYTIPYDPYVQAFRIGLGWQNLPSFPRGEGDIYYTIENRYQYRLDLISLKFYNTTKLTWVIFKENNIEHPIKDITAGTVLRIPNPTRVLAEV